MKTKLAFLAAFAAMMVPGLAVAQAIDATFPTSVAYTNGDTGAINVELTCNNGNPLVQSFDIAPGAPVTFTVTSIDPAIATCTVALSGLDAAYTAAGCTFSPGGTPVAAENVCDIVATPMATAVEVLTSVDTGGDPSIDTSAVTTISCDNVNPTTDSNFISVDVTNTDGSFNASWYANPAMDASCDVSVVFADSAIEASGCSFTFATGDEEAGCDVVGSVFFEGIPTLSQYGMAVMVLLMLGVGFVGFRRFV